MANEYMDTAFLDRAIIFAVRAHANTKRKGKGFPYIVHPLEAMGIVATITSDKELLAAAVLHDTVEDTDVTIEDIRREFGERVADIVLTETEFKVDNMSEKDSWHYRRQKTIDRLAAASSDAKIVAMGDKLSNMRAIARDYEQKGDDTWNLFNVNDPKEHEWHYRGLAASLSELKDTFAYREFVDLIETVFAHP